MDHLDTQELRDEVCARRIRGEKLQDICADEHLPSYDTLMKWWLGEPGDGHDAFRHAYAHALMAWAMGVVDEIVEIADDTSGDWQWSERKQAWVPDNDTPTRAKVRIDTRKWIATKMLPRLFGERMEIDYRSSDGSASGRRLTDAQLARLSTPALREVLALLREAEDGEPAGTIEATSESPALARERDEGAGSGATDASKTGPGYEADPEEV